MVRAHGHPRAVGSPYVFEHILVAESILGRYLVAGESVHHINGVRDDNRPGNLELWTRPNRRVSASVTPSTGRSQSTPLCGGWCTSNGAYAPA
jgi:hypothetical protein